MFNSLQWNLYYTVTYFRGRKCPYRRNILTRKKKNLRILLYYNRKAAFSTISFHKGELLQLFWVQQYYDNILDLVLPKFFLQFYVNVEPDSSIRCEQKITGLQTSFLQVFNMASSGLRKMLCLTILFSVILFFIILLIPRC